MQKYIDKSKYNEEYKLKIEGLTNGLSVLQNGYNRKKASGIVELSRYITAPKRWGFGLSRGFGEFLWEGGDWQILILSLSFLN